MELVGDGENEDIRICYPCSYKQCLLLLYKSGLKSNSSSHSIMSRSMITLSESRASMYWILIQPISLPSCRIISANSAGSEGSKNNSTIIISKISFFSLLGRSGKQERHIYLLLLSKVRVSDCLPVLPNCYHHTKNLQLF